MSTCPTKDIHSIYLDNEMPEIYKAEYEAHLQNCAKCRERLEHLKALRALLKEGSEDELSVKALDDSFERLQLKLKYSKNTGRAQEKKSFGGFKYVIPSAAAAAAVFALIIPLRLGTGNKSAVSSTSVASVTGNETTLSAPIIKKSSAATNVSFGSGRNVAISDNIHGTVMSSGQRSGNGFIQNVSDNSVAKNLIQDVDVFRPRFTEENAKSIKITVPSMNTIPVTVEIEFPGAVGQVLSEFDQ